MKGQAREGTGWSRGRENFDWYVNNNNSNSYFKILQLSGEAERQTAIVFYQICFLLPQSSVILFVNTLGSY